MNDQNQPFDFSNLDKLDPTEKVVRYYFPVNGYGYLEVKHTGRTNKPYTRAVARFNMGSDARKSANSGKIDVDSLLAHKQSGDRVLYPLHIVVGWGDIPDASGKEVEYSTAACKELFSRLPDWLLERVDSFCANPKNFIDDDEDFTAVDEVGLTETAKN